MSSPDRDILLGKAVGKIPSGLYILTIRQAEQVAAALVSWVQQAAFEPLSLSMAVSNQRSLAAMLAEGAPFALSVVGRSDTTLLKRYAKGIEPGQDPLEGMNVGATPAGQPYLADALAWLECRVARLIDFAADHQLVIAQVTAGQVLKEGPSYTHLRGSGYHY